ncbi:Fur family transcriptional regulator, ferric uptake regulator [Azospirillum oryzae]|uniref:Ferric uptake regulation protein n=1 Tax=Azospirillum oryzae TaxID=286727 RepID=A0A1X7HDA8_9PROT|nr:MULTISPECIES: Fur family transcriptional regulator [Azospirillum]PWC56562.1 Fur family transcriptional regulator [Azospirillum sp. TSH7]PWC64981.1 Fur family transcriptional regulator [Azospirillum sp. TSH20]SMF83413.1 Fur family transcriptional regulator, ferric uptake regulator [Azospirillum oryzae]
MTSRLEALCMEKGLKMTGQRRVISQVLSEADDHPDVEEVHRRAVQIDPRISIATVYRTMRLLEDAQVIERVDLGDGRARYEEATADHHHHLIDTRTGRIIEFASPELEAMKERIAHELGYKIVGHRLEIYGVPLDDAGDDAQDEEERP